PHRVLPSCPTRRSSDLASKTARAQKAVLDLLKKYPISIIAIGNGTASRETERFIANCLKESASSVSYVIVNEAGASVYSASALADRKSTRLNSSHVSIS